MNKDNAVDDTDYYNITFHRLPCIPHSIHTNTLQTNSASLASIVTVLVEITYHLEESSEGPSKVLAQCFVQALNTRFALFLQPTSTNFDLLPAAACLLETDRLYTLGIGNGNSSPECRGLHHL